MPAGPCRFQIENQVSARLSQGANKFAVLTKSGGTVDRAIRLLRFKATANIIGFNAPAYGELEDLWLHPNEAPVNDAST